MSRIHIGTKGDRVGFWVSAPDEDASAEIGRFLINSDWEHLKFNFQGQVEVSGLAGDGGYYYGTQSIATWSDLGYVPLAFIAVRGKTNSTMVYPPMGWSVDTGGDPNLTASFEIRSDRLIINSGFTAWSKIVVAYHIFKNRVPDLDDRSTV